MLKDLIEWLEKQNPDAVVPHGFGEPRSFRGCCEDVAFEPVENARIGDMLMHAKSALGRTFTGYKGGEYTMDEYSDCWIAPYGSSYQADKIGVTILSLWKACAVQRPNRLIMENSLMPCQFCGGKDIRVGSLTCGHGDSSE